ncbi:MAG: TIGR00730 family Rossman fold protein [Spirochaetes bacterium]|nr:MAG: TIGR00730 family Rossman fold protein [Spirochaetota bacterium]
MRRSVCVYCSSSDRAPQAHFDEARLLGRAIAGRGWTLVFGGADVGVMGALARAVSEAGGRVTGVVPAAIEKKGLAYAQADELVVTPDLRSRKERMESLADAFIALPGGFGTLEETLEIITLKQLGLHAKPIALVNTLGFYDGLMGLFERIYDEHFAKRSFSALFACTAGAEEALAYIDAYRPVPVESKWY